jgi:hypothetical protein
VATRSDHGAAHTAPTLHAYLIVFVIAGVSALGALGFTLLIPAHRRAVVRETVQAGSTT